MPAQLGSSTCVYVVLLVIVMPFREVSNNRGHHPETDKERASIGYENPLYMRHLLAHDSILDR